jgi:eukaryotic-like serine/threonine-protein kinase
MISENISHYRILHRIGSGGMGEVYMAKDTDLDRIVALKILRGDLASNPDRLVRFVQEAKAASALDHPNVAHIYEIGEADGVSFISMQYVEGTTVESMIQEDPLETKQILAIAIHVASALEEAHAKGIIHRDIKPSNIMMTPRGQAKVLDFGLAKVSPAVQQGDMSNLVTQVETVPGMIVGTVQYMSPEQTLGKVVDHRSDIFSFGTTLYQMATSRLPFSGETPTETMNLVINATPEPIARFSNKIPYELERIIRKCLEKDPDRRYQSARDMLIDLKHLQRDSLSGEKPAVTLPEAVPRTNRYWKYVGLGLVLFALAAISIGIYFSRNRAQTIHSLAVLPFINGNADSGMQYVSDGITEGIINSLSRLPELKVLASGTVFQFHGETVDPRNVGKELGVDAVVTGRVIQQNDMLIVQVDLVNTSDGTQVWGERYSKRLSDMVQLESDISTSISDELRLKLTGQQKERLNRHNTENTEAYQLYLKGRFYWNKRSEDGFRKAVESFERAIDLDPEFALAYAGLADCYGLLSNWGFIPPKEGYVKAQEAETRALALDDELAEAHTSLAFISVNYNWNFPLAEKEYKRAIELNPNYATAHHWYSLYLSQMGRSEEAINEMQKALQIDPLSAIINSNLGYTYYLARRYDPAVDQLKRTLDLIPNFGLAYQYLGLSYVEKRMFSESLAFLEKANQASPEYHAFRASLASTLAKSGNLPEAEKYLQDLESTSRRRYVSPVDMAYVFAAMDRKDLAFELLEKAYSERSDLLVYMKVEPRYDPLRQDPRFDDLIRRIGLR